VFDPQRLDTPSAQAVREARTRLWLGAIAGAGLVAAAVTLARVPNLVEAPRTFLVLFGLAFACYAGGLRALLPDAGTASRAVVTLVLGVGLAARVVLLPAPPTLSTDAYRYVWDARVAAAGIDPYAHPPSAPEVAALRDDAIYPRLNHLEWRTIYPPGAQALFRFVYALAPDSVVAMKTAIALGELVALLLLLAVLRRLELPLARAAVYAWNPLVLVEIWGTGHLDGLVLPAIVGATLAAVAGRPVIVAAALAAGTLLKLYPMMLLLLLVAAAVRYDGARRRRAWAVALGVFGGIVVLGYAPLVRSGAAALGSLPRYLREEHFNPGLVRTVVDSPAVTLAVVLLWIAWATWSRGTLGERARRLTGGITVLSPNVFPWYAVWLVPFLALAPSAAWIAFTGVIAFSYAFFLTTPWAIPVWARVAELVPVILAVAGAVRSRREFTRS